MGHNRIPCLWACQQTRHPCRTGPRLGIFLDVATIPVGYYSGTTLAAAIQTALNTSSASYNTYSVTYSTTTYKMTFSAGNAFVIKAGSP